MKSYYVYILECADGSYYTGVTNNLDRRIKEHEEGYADTSYTVNRRPVTPVFSQEFFDIFQAIALEKQIKGWSRGKKKAFIDENWAQLSVLAQNSKKRNSAL